MLDLVSIQIVAEEAALKAGAALLAHRQSATVFQTKADLASSADQLSDGIIKAHLLAAYPRIPFFSEETGPAARTGTYWLVDAVDGTLNYYRGGYDWCISIALVENGQTTAGVIYQPELGRFYSARIRYGTWSATITDPRNPPSQVYDTSNAIFANNSVDPLATQFYFDWGKDTPDGSAHRSVYDLIAKLDRACFYPQVGGSAALAAITVAWGRSDGYVGLKVEDVDVAAAYIICSEACAVVTDRFGNPWTDKATSFVVGTKRTHPILLEIVRSVN